MSISHDWTSVGMRFILKYMTIWTHAVGVKVCENWIKRGNLEIPRNIFEVKCRYNIYYLIYRSNGYVQHFGRSMAFKRRWWTYAIPRLSPEAFLSKYHHLGSATTAIHDAPVILLLTVVSRTAIDRSEAQTRIVSTRWCISIPRLSKWRQKRDPRNWKSRQGLSTRHSLVY